VSLCDWLKVDNAYQVNQEALILRLRDNITAHESINARQLLEANILRSQGELYDEQYARAHAGHDKLDTRKCCAAKTPLKEALEIYVDLNLVWNLPSQKETAKVLKTLIRGTTFSK
jgi:hypothetical protein